MSCTCKYGSGRVCGFCEYRAQVNARLKKLEAQESDGYARGVAAERARVVAWLHEVVETMRRNNQSYGYVEDLADAIERGEHEENDNG